MIGEVVETSASFEARFRATTLPDNLTLTRHRAENECPRDWAVCEKQQRKGGKNGSQLCYTM